MKNILNHMNGWQRLWIICSILYLTSVLYIAAIAPPRTLTDADTKIIISKMDPNLSKHIVDSWANKPRDMDQVYQYINQHIQNEDRFITLKNGHHIKVTLPKKMNAPKLAINSHFDIKTAKPIQLIMTEDALQASYEEQETLK